MDATEVGIEVFGLGRVEPDLAALAEEYDPTPDPYVNDPVAWVEERLEEELWSMQREILESVRDHRHTAVQSCHGPGKSYTAARAACWWLDVHALGEAFVVTTAPTWRQVFAVLWREMRRAHRKGKLPGRTTLDATWYLGGSGRPGHPDEELVAMGRKPADYDPDAFQGIHAKYVLVILDEAGGVPKALYDAVDSLATNDFARVLAVGNPDDPASHFAKVCAPGSGWNNITISAFDTPNFTDEIDELSEEMRHLLVSPTWVEERKKRWGETSPTYISKVLGQFPDISDDTLISPRLIREAQERELVGLAKGSFGADIARLGQDETCVYRNRGGVIRLAYSAHKQDTKQTSNAFAKLLKDTKRAVPMVVDEVGIGAGVLDNLRDLKLPVRGFNGGSRAFDPDRFINRRAEVYWTFRERMEAEEIDLPPQGEDDDLISQLGSIRWHIDSRGRIGIESKDDMKKRGLPSPDRADAAVQAVIELPAITVPKNAGERRETLTGDLLKREM